MLNCQCSLVPVGLLWVFVREEQESARSKVGRFVVTSDDQSHEQQLGVGTAGFSSVEVSPGRVQLRLDYSRHLIISACTRTLVDFEILISCANYSFRLEQA